MKKETKDRILSINAEIRGILNNAKDAGQLTEEMLSTIDNLKAERSKLAAEETTLNNTKEMENQELIQARGNALKELATSNQGVVLPEERSAMSSTNVANVAPLSIGEVIYGLNTKTVFDKVGARIQYGLSGDWEYPVVDSIQAAFAGETASLSDTNITIGACKPSPKRLGIKVPISRTALNRGGARLLDIIQTSIAYGLAKKLNASMFALTAESNGVSGPFVAPTTANTYTHGGSPTFADVVKLAGDVKSTGIEVDETGAYVMTPAMAAKLQATPITSGDSRMILENGRINGFPVFETVGAPDGAVLFGYFSYCLCGQFGEMALGVDPYSSMANNVVNFILNADWDIKSARAAAFGKLTEAAQ